MRTADVPQLASIFEGMRSDYAAAKHNRFRRRRTGVPSLGSGADYHYRVPGDFLRMMEYARDMDRCDAVVGQTIDRAVTNTVQDGIGVQPKTGDADVDRDLSLRWRDWSEEADNCDRSGEHCFAEQQWLGLRHNFVDGDVIFLPEKESGALEGVEAHRLRTPSNAKKNRAQNQALIHGVLIDGHRRRLQYWLTKNDIDLQQPLKSVQDVKKYDARDEDGHRQVFHLYTAKRLSQTRGVTALAPIFDICGMFEDINFAKLVHQQVVSCFAIFRQRDLEFRVPETEPQLGARQSETLPDGASRMLEGVGPGMHMAGLPGETLSMGSPNVPNPEFFPHVRLILTLIGINLGVPLVMMLMDANETNFSGWRGAVNQARMGFKHNQNRLIRRVIRPTYLWKVRQWMAENPALRNVHGKNGVDVYRHQNQRPAWPYVQPLQDSTTDLLRKRNGLSSGRRIAAERNVDYDELVEEIVEDNAKLIRTAYSTAAKLNEESPGLDVTWRELANSPTPDGVNITLPVTPAGQRQQNSEN